MLEQMTAAEFLSLVEVVQATAAAPDQGKARVAPEPPTWTLDADVGEALSALSRFGLGRSASDDPGARSFDGPPDYVVSLEWETLNRLAALFG